MAEDSDLEKTEEPTGRRLEQAREKGQVPQSRELGTFVILITAAAMLWMMGGWFMARILELMRQSLIVDPKYFLEPNLMVTRFASLFGDSLVVLAPLFVGLVVASLLPPFFLNAWVFAPKKLMPELNRMNPIAGIGRMFSWNSLMELGKAVLKATLVGGVAVLLISHQRDEIFGLLAEPLEKGLAHAGQMILFSFMMLVLTLFLVVAADVPFQLWQHFKQLKMRRKKSSRK